MEGVTSGRARWRAPTLGNLIVIWDDNEISIEGTTRRSRSPGRPEAVRGPTAGVQRVEGGERRRPGRPSPRPGRHRQAVVHRPSCGRHHRRRARFGRRRGPGLTGRSSTSPRVQPASSSTGGQEAHEQVDPMHGPAQAIAKRCSTGCWPGTCRQLGRRPAANRDQKPVKATAARHSGDVPRPSNGLPELWGGSADLAEAATTSHDEAPESFGPPPSICLADEGTGTPPGTFLRPPASRRHAMGAILSGIVLRTDAGPTASARSAQDSSPTTDQPCDWPP